MQSYIGLDWGSSSMTAWKITDNKIVDTRTLALGITKLGGKSHHEVLISSLGDWLLDCSMVVGVGMIGSTLGMHETPYLQLPASVHDLVENAVRINDLITITDAPAIPLVIIPGVSKSLDGDFDVMRGEESQALSLNIKSGLALIPGTHSKWISVQDGAIIDFRSYLTGELYALLLRQSTLTQAVSDESEVVSGNSYFHIGLDSPIGSLTHELFTVRARWLQGLGTEDARNYLSGLLIGAELGHYFQSFKPSEVHLLSIPVLGDLYQRALTARGVKVVMHDTTSTLAVFLQVIADFEAHQ